MSVTPVAVSAFLGRGDTTSVQILGPAGHGKSSTLRAVMREARQLQGCPQYEYIPNGTSVFVTGLLGDCWFCVDEAQRLSNRERERLIHLRLQHGTRLFLASHEDLTTLFRTNNLPLHTVTLNTIGESHFDAILENRLTYFAFPGEPHATFSRDALVFLRERFGSDLRQAERFLFDFFQTSVRVPEPIVARQLRRESRSSP